jgi:hypothetical protein
MAFDVSALDNYTDEQSKQYLYQTIAEGETIGLIPNTQTGVKSAEKLKIITSTGVWQAGGSCAFSASGDTAFSERTITIGKVKVDLSWCPEDLETKYTQLALPKGANYDMIAFKEEITTMLANKDKHKMELVVWNGDTTSGDAYLSRFDGFRKIIKASSGVLTTADHNTTAWSAANARTIVQGFVTKLVASLPQHLGDSDLRLFMGLAEYYTLKQKYITDNLYHITGEQGVVHVEGTNIPIVPVLGLSGKKEFYLMKLSNMYKAVDLESDQDSIEMWYSQDDRVVKYSKKWKFGVQVAFPDEIIYATLT